MAAELGGTFGGRVVIDPVKLADFLRSPNGPLVRRMVEDGQKVKAEAQRRVGVYGTGRTAGADTSRRRRRPGTLRDSIVTRLVSEPSSPIGLVVLVGSEDEVALLHHEGTRPHVIAARNAPLLVFYWPKVGRVVAFPRVNHPGTQPNRYLTDALSVLR